jgi:peptidyl-prolyl cis-trans isomerase D
MLSKIRSFSGSLLVRILLLFVVITVVIWGVGDRRSRDTVVSIDGDDSISVSDLEKGKKRYSYLLRINHPEVNPETVNIPQIVIDQLIQAKLIELETKKLGLHVSDEVVVEQIRKLKIFHDKEGKFDGKLFKSWLTNSRVNEREYIDSIKAELASITLTSTLPKHISVSTELLDRFYMYRHQTRTVDLVKITKRGNSNSTITDAQIKDYYESHKQQFTLPERRDIELITIKPSQFSKDIVVTDEEVEEELRGAKMNKFGIRQNLLKSKSERVMHEKIKEIEDNLSAGDSFKDVTTKYGVEYKAFKSIDRSVNGLDAKVVSEAFELSAGTPSDTFQPKVGVSEYTIINVKKIYPEEVKPIEAVQREIIATLQAEHMETNAKEAAAGVYNSFSGNSSKDVSVTPLELNLHKAPLTQLEYQDVIGAFNLAKAGSRTHLFKTKDKHYAFMVLKEIKWPKVVSTSTDYKNFSGFLSKLMVNLVNQEFMQNTYSAHDIKLRKGVSI